MATELVGNDGPAVGYRTVDGRSRVGAALMSKIEVLRVPDHYIDNDTIVITDNGKTQHRIHPVYKPALLAALLEDAGAVRIYMETDNQGEIGMVLEPPPALCEMWNELCGPFDAWILPIPEDTLPICPNCGHPNCGCVGLKPRKEDAS